MGRKYTSCGESNLRPFCDPPTIRKCDGAEEAEDDDDDVVDADGDDAVLLLL